MRVRQILAVAPAPVQQGEAPVRGLAVGAGEGYVGAAALEGRVLPAEVEGASLDQDVVHQDLAQHFAQAPLLQRPGVKALLGQARSSSSATTWM